MMRIITGRARGTHLLTLEGEATRPTSERAKEAVFSMIQFDLPGRVVLDLFGGSGQMALEAVSRGAKQAVLVDASRDATDIIRKNVIRTGFSTECTVLTEDYETFLKRRHTSGLPDAFSLIFLDPPYALHAVAPALRGLVTGGWLAQDALIVCESGEEDIFGEDQTLASAFQVLRKAKYGVAYMTLLGMRCKEDKNA